MILIERIDADVAISPGAKCVVDLPGIGVGEVEDYGISQHVPGSHSHALQVQLALEETESTKLGSGILKDLSAERKRARYAILTATDYPRVGMQ